LDLNLKGKVAIITGGNRGIGKGIARQLAKEAAVVALAARDMQALEAAAAEIVRDTGSQVCGFKVDTGEDASVKAMVADVAAAFGRVDILINCAAQPGGQGKPPALAEISNDAFYSDMNVKVMGYLRCIREVVPHMRKQGSGRIVNISGLATRNTGSIIGSIRNVSVAALTKNLADELSPFGISVVCVHPGLTRTEKTRGVFERRAKSEGISIDEIEQRIAQGNLVRKMITVDELGGLVTFLASPWAIAINGDSIAAGGGTPGSIYY
jgi:NAD(P)-dependent dehydrogenase (short-subunit alcohol dehydrogenase family)